MPAAATRKRKEIDDMADPSPPKRVTRARAAKGIEESEKSAKIAKTTKITTASARAATKAKSEPSKLTRTTRKAQVEEATKEDVTPENEVAEDAPKAAKTRGRPKKTAATTAESSVSKTKTRQSKVAANPASTKTTRATRAQKVAETTTGEQKIHQKEVPDETEDKKPSKKPARCRPATTSRRLASAPEKKPVTRKKVAFVENPEDDKENAPAPTDAKKMQPVKSTGLRAQPVRKPAAPPRATRGRKPAAGKDAVASDGELKPLSPKKPTQVAKHSSSESEDELCAAAPVKALSKSPVKPSTSIHGSPVKPSFSNCSQNLHIAESPVKQLGTSVLASPAKRPPSSPFKPALSESPKKITLPCSPEKPCADSMAQSPFKESLKASPKRVQLNPTVPKPNASPLKQSLLQSPARRPTSPLKSSLFASTSKSEVPAFNASTFMVPSLTPKRHVESLTVGDESPEPSIKSHTLTPEEQAAIRLRDGSPSPVRRTSTPIQLDDFSVSTTPPDFQESLFVDTAASLFPPNQSPADEPDSEDELRSGPTTLQSSSKVRSVAVKDFALDVSMNTVANDNNSFMSDQKLVEPLSMTPLALQLSTWCDSSLEKGVSDTRDAVSQEFSTPSSPVPFIAPQQDDKLFHRESPAKKSEFEEQMFGRDQEFVPVLDDEDFHKLQIDENINSQDVCKMDIDDPEVSTVLVDFAPPVTDSQASNQYGDENLAPVDPLLVFAPTSSGNQQAPSVCCDMTVSTPEQAPRIRNKEIHTVSKVPLRAADDDHSPIKIPRKRSKSTSAPLAEIGGEPRSTCPPMNPLISYSLGDVVEEEIADQTTPGRKVSFETQTIKQLMTPAKGQSSARSSPFKSERKGADAQILRGAVVFVDVHTSEGADASGIFIELLTGMGARCIKQWTWNPRVSSAGDQASTPSIKVGITHVVYKDGGKRTLQKVREAKGLVACVGVAWVLDCERENKWLDEASYAVDTSTIPRGGHNRRKSMEPTRFSNYNSNLVLADGKAQTPARTAAPSPTIEFLNFSAESRRSSIRPLEPPKQDVEDENLGNVPSTPTPNNDLDIDELDAETSWGSPTTPYFLGKGAQLVQMTCPPKQTMQSLFPVSGRIEDHPDEAVRRRLVEARRKSLQWAPKVASPLGRGVFNRDN